MKEITAIELAEELFKIHTHAYLNYGSEVQQIVYREKDIIALLQQLGYPEPDWDGYSNKCERELLSCPGDTIVETLEYNGITNQQFLHLLNNKDHAGYIWNEEAISKLFAGQLEIDNLIAEDLERVLNVPKEFWLNHEKLYREKLSQLK